MAASASSSPAGDRSRLITSAIGILPFIVFALMFLILPTALLLSGAFFDAAGSPTLANLTALWTQPEIRYSFWLSIQISFYSALFGAVVGFLVAYAIVLGNLPAWVRPATTTFSGVASNFAGIPLAFAFIATIGPVGFITTFLRDHLGINLRAYGFNLLSLQGLVIVYLYFQVALMVLVITPALDGLKREWREACAVLGGTSRHYWRYIALPILWPSILGATLLLFANAFGAVATAYALTGSTLQIIPIQLFAQIRGDVLHNPQLGYAIAFGMVIVTTATSGAYILLKSYAERWVR